uniref:Putative ATP synthase CF1 subunit delta n=1 Tax=Pseudellipsoidion edaphicum TaxID=1431838 RepID=A0A3R5TA92_9STRA|nr:putative ATP synthase CF1 subunit delta [Pseudellipsoidion edaphicum]QAA12021.1 putative ATP synthase CF1 subunit delta [Pseudellipsoidion edaphicum]
MGCLDKIQLSQNLIQNFVKAFLSVPNSYDMYHTGLLLRTLAYSTEQTFPKVQNVPKQSRTNLNSNLTKYSLKNSIRYKLALKRKDSEDFLVWKLLLPSWKTSFTTDLGPVLGKWLYDNFKNRMVLALSSIIPSIFDRICRIHRIRIIDEICTVNDWTSRFNSIKLMDKLSDVLDFTDENPVYLNPNDHAFLIRKQTTSRSIIRGYKCRVDSVVFNFTTNRLLGGELVKHFYEN